MASELLPTNVANISKHESCYPLLLKSILFGVVLAPLAMTNSPAFSALATDSLILSHFSLFLMSFLLKHLSPLLELPHKRLF